MNVAFEKLNDTFTTLSCLEDDEFIGFYFDSEAECTLFSTMLADLTERLTNDSEGSKALKEVAKTYG